MSKGESCISEHLRPWRKARVFSNSATFQLCEPKQRVLTSGAPQDPLLNWDNIRIYLQRLL